MARGAASSGSGVGGQPRSQAGDKGRGLKREERGELDPWEVMTRPREQHFVFDLAGNLRKNILESLSLVNVPTHLIFADWYKVDHRKCHRHRGSGGMVVHPDLAKWDQVALVNYFIKGRHHADIRRRNISRRPRRQRNVTFVL